MQLYLDLDGVFANFDKRAKELFNGLSSKEFENQFGTKQFWKIINSDPNFFLNLEIMENSMIIYEAVKHHDPIILTGIPTNKNAISHKKEWVARVFGNDQKIICCPSKEKSLYCKTGDVIIDDTEKHMQKWIDKGGIWILHKSVEQTMAALKELYLI